MTPEHSPAHIVRLRCRANTLSTPTSGLAPGHMQANLLILPSSAAHDFLSLCARNPVPCPLIGHTPLSSTGNASLFTPSHQLPHIPLLKTRDFDLRTDLPLYNIYHDGVLVAQKNHVMDEWTDDHVAFLIGCSFGFENALYKAGLPSRHWEESMSERATDNSTHKKNVPMYRTTLPLAPSGIFTSSTYVVSMRPYRSEDVEQVRAVTRPFESMHGEPIAWGWEALDKLGIADIATPEFGEMVEIREGEVPVFWGCGVTPQVAVMEAGKKVKGTVMAHAPGCMLVLDLTEEELLGSI